MDYKPFESVMFLLAASLRARLRRGGVCFDPFAHRLPRGILVGIVIVAAEKVDFQVRRLAQAGDLVTAMGDWARSRIAGRLALRGFMLPRDKANAERLDGANGAGGRLPVEVFQR
jgi:hypothetical protein